MQRKRTYIVPEGLRERVFADQADIAYRGSTRIDSSAYISDTCWIAGDVRIGPRAVIFNGASLRGDNDYIEIGAETNVQEGCLLHESKGAPIVVGEHSTLGHGCVLHACTVGDNSLVGMNAVVLNDAVIGNNCIVGAGAVVPEGMVVPDFHMVLGVPAKIKGAIAQEKVVSIIEELTEGNLAEAERMFKEGLLFHPTPALLRAVRALA